MSNFDAFEIKMRAAGMGDAPVAVFKRNYEALLRNETWMIPEDSIEPAGDLPKAEKLDSSGDDDLLGQVVVVKLNGGLGTGMGLQAPKSLLSVRKDVNFLDLMVRQTISLREKAARRCGCC